MNYTEHPGLLLAQTGNVQNRVELPRDWRDYHQLMLAFKLTGKFHPHSVAVNLLASMTRTTKLCFGEVVVSFDPKGTLSVVEPTGRKIMCHAMLE